MTSEEKKAARLKYLNKVYELTEGDYNAHLYAFEVGDELGFDRDLTENVFSYLNEEGLIEYRQNGHGLTITISHRGVREVEEARSHPDKPTQYFPPAVNVITIHSMTNSTIQQGSPGARQAVRVDDSSLNDVRTILDGIKRVRDGLGLDEEQKGELDAEVATAEAQLSSPKPKMGILAQCLDSAKGILATVTGDVAAETLKAQIDSFLGKLSGS